MNIVHNIVDIYRKQNLNLIENKIPYLKYKRKVNKKINLFLKKKKKNKSLKKRVMQKFKQVLKKSEKKFVKSIGYSD
jgi:hypothetical protein